MIPVQDVIPSRTTPWVTLVLIGVNAVVFAYELALDADARLQFFFAYGLVPAEFSWTTAVTSMFLHSGWLQVGGNLLALWIFGDNVEDRLGHGRFLVFYALAGCIAALAQTWADRDSLVPLVGASGAIAGVLGAYVVMFPHSRILVLVPLIVIVEVIEIPAVFLLGFWVLMQLLDGVGRIAAAPASGSIAFLAHAAGFLTGLLAVRLFRRPERQRVEWWTQGRR
jgi:membrane associated rhomboid family serine protease